MPINFGLPPAWTAPCIHALEDGWLITPKEPARIEHLLYSKDLHTWHDIEIPEIIDGLPASVITAGNKIFLVTGETQTADDPETGLEMSFLSSVSAVYVADVGP